MSIVQFSDFSVISTVAVALAFTVGLVAVLFLLAVAVNDSWGQCYKTFLVCNLQVFVMSWSVCPWQAFQVYSNKQCSLVQKSVNHRPIKFYNIGPFCEYYTNFLHP